MPSYLPDHNESARVVDYIGGSTFVFLQFLNVCISVFYISTPDLPDLFGYYLPLDKWYWFPLAYLFCPYISFIVITQFAITFSIAYYYGVVYVPLILKELCLGRIRYRAVDTLRKPDNLIISYRMAQIVQQMINAVIGKLLIPTQATLTFSFVFGCCLIIKHKNELSAMAVITIVFWSIIPNIFWATFLCIGGYMHCQGKKILNSWRYDKWQTRKEKQLMAKRKKSCKPLTLNYETCFVIKNQSLLVFIRGLTRGLMRALLSIRKFSR